MWRDGPNSLSAQSGQKAASCGSSSSPAAMPRRASSYAYEPKWDGFRALLRTEHGFRVLSRRRWNMTPLLPELEAFPVPGVFDGELIAFSEGQPDFVALCDRMLLHRDLKTPVAFVAFDVLSLEGTNVMREPYWKRREILESLELVGSHWITTPSFNDGDALWTVVEEQDLEGLVAKPLGSTYKPNERAGSRSRTGRDGQMRRGSSSLGAQIDGPTP
jgi:bifunctional non-homologous end joining protein LigD